MKGSLKKIKIEEISKIVDKDTSRQIKKNKLPVFKLDKVELRKKEISDPLLRLEITLRKCERVGVFRK